MPLHQVAVFNPFPFVLGQRIHIAGGPRTGDWQVIGLSERKVQLKCPVSGREGSGRRYTASLGRASRLRSRSRFNTCCR